MASKKIKTKSKKKINKKLSTKRKTNPKTSKRPSRTQIVNWMIEYISEHPSFQGSHNEIMLLSTKAKKHFELKDIDLYDLANEADHEYLKATVRYT